MRVNQPDWDELKLGDVLLYGGWSIPDITIWLKTWSDAQHVEIYTGNGQSIASRPGIGVNLYPLRKDGIRYALRPNQPFDFLAGMAWFNTNAKGQPYAWLDLVEFYPPIYWLLTKLGFLKIKGLICSEFGDLFFQNCVLRLFNPDYPVGAIAPRDYLVTPLLDLVWSWKPSF